MSAAGGREGLKLAQRNKIRGKKSGKKTKVTKKDEPFQWADMVGGSKGKLEEYAALDSGLPPRRVGEKTWQGNALK